MAWLKTTFHVRDVLYACIRIWNGIGWRGIVCRETGGMRHQVMYAYGRRFARLVFPILETRDIAVHCIQHPELPLFAQNECRNGCGHCLAARRHVEDGVCRHGSDIGPYLTVSVGFQIGHLAMSYNSQHSTRDITLPDGIFNNRVGLEQSLRVHADLLRPYMFKLLCVAES